MSQTIPNELRAVFDSMEDGILVSDLSGRYRYLNEVALRLMGFTTPEEVLETPVRELRERFQMMAPDGRPIPPQQMPPYRAGLGEKPPPQEVRCRSVYWGGDRYGTIVSTPCFDAQGKVDSVITRFRDTTVERRVARDGRFLSELSAALAAPLDLDEALKTLVRRVVPELADCCAVELMDRGERRLVVAHADPSREGQLRAAWNAIHPEGAPPTPAMQSRQPLFLPELSAASMRLLGRPREDFQPFAELKANSLISVPLVARGHALGIITLFSVGERHLDLQDVALARELGQRASLAVDNVRLYEESLDALLRKKQEAALSEALRRLGTSLSSELDTARLLERVTAEALPLTGATFAAFLELDPGKDSAPALHTVSGLSREQFLKDALPRAKELLPLTFENGGVVRCDDVLVHPLLSRSSLRPGAADLPAPLTSYLAVPVASRAGVAQGALLFGHPGHSAFSREHEALAVNLAAQVSVALDNARLFSRLQQTEAQLNLAMEQAKLGYFEMDVLTREVSLSRSFELILGVPPGTYRTFETYGRSVHPDDHARIREQNEKLFASKAVSAFFSYRIVRPDGKVRWLEGETHVIRDGQGRVIRTVGMRADVTERKAAEERLRASEERLRLALAAGHMGHWEWTIPAGVLNFSPDMERMHGLAPGTFGGSSQDYARLIHPDDLPAMAQATRDVLADGGAGYAQSYRIVLSDGSTRWMESRGTLLRDAAGAPHRLVGICADITERTRAEARLKRREEQLRLALQAAHMGYYDWDPKTGHAELSPEMEAIYGVSASEQDGLAIFNRLVLPEDQALVMKHSQQLRENPAGEEALTYRIRRPDGQVRWIDGYLKLLRDASGNPVRMLGIARDATGRVEAEEKARRLVAEQAARVEAEAGQRRVAAILDSISEPLYALDHDARVRFLNRPAEALAGQKREALIGQCAREQPLFQRQPALLQHWERALKDGQPVEAEETMPEGTRYEVRAHPYDEGVSLYLHDVTARHRAQEAQARLARYEALRADVSTALSGGGGLTAVLQRCAEALVSHLGVAAASLWKLDASGEGMEMAALAGQLPFPGRPRRVPLHLLHHLGDEAAVRRSHVVNDINLLEDPTLRELARRAGFTAHAHFPLVMGHQVLGSMAMFSFQPFPEDLLPSLNAIADALAQGLLRQRAEDALKDHAQELVRANTELARSNAELEQFAYVASHDLQEPLRMVASFTELLARRYRGSLDEKADRYISFTLDGVNRMQRLIQDLLAFSRVGTRAHAPAPIGADTALSNALRNLHAALAESHGEVTADPLPEVLADETQLVQLFQNLLGNGLKFHVPGTPPRLHVSATREGDRWTFAVKDNGIGIEARYFDRIFILFQRLHGKSRYPGTGIGLAICKKIVERHGGRIWVESAPGQGATFLFTLPAPPAAQPPTSERSESP